MFSQRREDAEDEKCMLDSGVFFYYPVKPFGLATPSSMKGKKRGFRFADEKGERGLPVIATSPSLMKGWIAKQDGVVEKKKERKVAK